MIVELLAQLKRCTPAEVEAKLEQTGGKEDSHRLVRVLPKLRRRLGINLKPGREMSAALGSVETLADYVFAVAGKEAA